MMTREAAADLLGVPVDADEMTIAAAWRTAARHHHPDLGGDPDQFVELSTAMETLTFGEVSEAVPPPKPVIQARLERRVMWWAMATGSASAVAIVVVVLVLAPTAATVGPIVMVAVGWIGHRTWLATGRPGLRLPTTRGWSWTTSRSTSDEKH